MNRFSLSHLRLALPAGAVALLFLTAGVSAQAQAPDAAERCTPDVQRLCGEFIPDEGKIVACLKAKRKQLSESCLGALTSKAGGEKPQRRRAKSE